MYQYWHQLQWPWNRSVVWQQQEFNFGYCFSTYSLRIVCVAHRTNVSVLLSSVTPPGSAAQPFSPFWFTVEPQDTLAIRGNSALLNCSAHSDAATTARIEWKKDGTFMSLVSDERRNILPDGSLFFNHVVHSKHNKPDEGTYQCVATIDNLGSISSRTARLSVAGKCCQIYQSSLLIDFSLLLSYHRCPKHTHTHVFSPILANETSLNKHFKCEQHVADWV